MKPLDRKLLRDFRRLKGQVITIALVLACGVMGMVMLRGTFSSLVGARDAYYAEQRFADVFATLERAPESVAARLGRIPGVSRVYTRIVEDVMVPLPERLDPVTGRIVTIPEDGPPPLNGIVLRRGRMPAREAAEDEVLILEQFAKATGVEPGDRLPAVLNGTLKRLQVVGIAMSPEYIFAMSGYEMVADEKRFVVIWMLRERAAAAFRMEGAFNDVTLALQPGASLPAVLDHVDRELAPYGGFRAVARDKQLSSYALNNELEQLGNLALTVPVIFLAVAAFLVNIVISRLVFLERTQIAVLKALGYRNRTIGWHYLGLVGLIVALGSVIGVAAGIWAGRWMTNMYSDFFKFPGSVYELSLALAIGTIAIALVAAVVGALASVRRIAKLPPAEAMRPPAPLIYRRTLWERLGLARIAGTAATMTAREINRRPFRFMLSASGIAMGVAVYILGSFSWDSFDYLIKDFYFREHHEDLTVTFNRPIDARAVRELEALPGVLLAEGQRIVPVRLRAGPLWRNVAIFGMPARGELRVVFDDLKTEVEMPAEGVVVTSKLAEILRVGVGDTLQAEILEGDFATRRVRIAGLLEEPWGLQAYGRMDWVHELMREEPRVTTVLLRVDPAERASVRARLKEMPAVAGVVSTSSIIENYEKQTGQTLAVITLILALSAAAIAIGVVYNNARIALSMRSRDLASLRVLGFTRKEISTMLLSELAVQVLVGVPLGLILGVAWAEALAATFNPEAMRFPVHVAAETFGTAASIAVVSGLVSAMFVRRRLDELDLIGVLKAAE